MKRRQPMQTRSSDPREQARFMLREHNRAIAVAARQSGMTLSAIARELVKTIPEVQTLLRTAEQRGEVLPKHTPGTRQCSGCGETVGARSCTGGMCPGCSR